MCDGAMCIGYMCRRNKKLSFYFGKFGNCGREEGSLTKTSVFSNKTVFWSYCLEDYILVCQTVIYKGHSAQMEC